MTYAHLLYEERDQIAYVTVNHPERLNVLNRATVDEIDAVFVHISGSEALRAVILTGAGEKAFVAGADIGELARQTPLEGARTSLRGQQVLRRIETAGVPVIAAINGFALGGGCELALACTLRIASKNARFGLPEVKLGIMPGYAGTQRLPRLVGAGRALELMLTGEMIDAEEAFRIGLVNRVTSPADLLPTAEKLARQIVGNAPLGVRLCLDAVHHGAGMPLEESARYEASLFGLLCATEDMREGLNAFLEKRKPNFLGR
ncbi:MAG: enoyl-CoA hydratase/isomerase family protein [Acidobacteria bacterium]|nr:enoyl-CoA hydratase/isomerase family protein [Acidobacteriota bacterium]